MNVRRETHAQATVVIPEGRLDFVASAGFQQQLEQALAGDGTPPAAVIVDCEGLDYVSSAGLRVLLLAARDSHRAGIGFAVCALRPVVREVFDLSGFSRLIAVHPDRRTALDRARPPCA